MESAKPIEAGCMAMVMGTPKPKPEYAYAIIKVIRHCTEEEMRGFPVEPRWLVDVPADCPSGYWSCPERKLMRIDDPELKKQNESEKEIENV